MGAPVVADDISLKRRLYEAVRRFLWKHAGITMWKFPQSIYYNSDGLLTLHNHTFMEDPDFIRAHQRAVKAGGWDQNIQWRVHIALWAAGVAARLDGDFVECGVNAGYISSAILQFLNWNSLNKHYYLFDTFAGMDERFITEEEKKAGKLEINRKVIESGGYVTDVERIKKNFSEWKNIEIVQGTVPETLNRVDIRKVAFIHLDMNCSIPEYMAMKHFWPRMVSGAVILFDDYAYRGYETQKKALDKFAVEAGIGIASLPTGQGLAIKS
jgi:hypothetical protein